MYKFREYTWIFRGECLDPVPRREKSASWFNTIPTPLFEFDFSKTREHFDSLSLPDETPLRPYLEANPDILRGCITSAKLTAVNKSAMELYGVKTGDELKSHLKDIIGKNGITTLLNGSIALLEGKTFFEGEPRITE